MKNYLLGLPLAVLGFASLPAHAFTSVGVSKVALCAEYLSAINPVTVEIKMIKDAVADMYSRALDQCAQQGLVAVQNGPMSIESAAHCRLYRSGRIVQADFSCQFPIHIEER